MVTTSVIAPRRENLHRVNAWFPGTGQRGHLCPGSGRPLRAGLEALLGRVVGVDRGERGAAVTASPAIGRVGEQVELKQPVRSGLVEVPVAGRTRRTVDLCGDEMEADPERYWSTVDGGVSSRKRSAPGAVHQAGRGDKRARQHGRRTRTAPMSRLTTTRAISVRTHDDRPARCQCRRLSRNPARPRSGVSWPARLRIRTCWLAHTAQSASSVHPRRRRLASLGPRCVWCAG